MERVKEIEERYAALSESEKRRFLACLAYYISQTARGSYVEAGNSAETACQRLRAWNEVFQILSKQLMMEVGQASGGDYAYPDEVIFNAMAEAFRPGGEDLDVLIGAIYDAFRELFRSDAQE